MGEKYYTYEDLSKHWKVAVNTLRQYVMAGKLMPSFRIGRLVRFSESYILDIESNGGINNIGLKGGSHSKMASPNSISDHISEKADR